MTTSTALPAAATARERVIATGCAALGILSLLTAAAVTVDPAGFLGEVGGFGAVNEHLVRDVATWSATLGAALLVAARLAAWRVPILAFAVLQGVLHMVNHVFDAGIAEPGWKGWATVGLLAGITLVTAWLLIAAQREERA